MQIDFNITGLKEINALLKELPEKAQERVIKSAVRSGAQVVRKEAKRLVPKDTGELERSIKVQAGRPRSKSKITFRVGFEKTPDGRSPSRRAHLTEFGTSTQPAQPFMRPALDSKASEVINKMISAIGRGIAREAEKLAGLRGRKR
jgi:HK97 gp10 family phage protein